MVCSLTDHGDHLEQLNQHIDSQVNKLSRSGARQQHNLLHIVESVIYCLSIKKYNDNSAGSGKTMILILIFGAKKAGSIKY